MRSDLPTRLFAAATPGASSRSSPEVCPSFKVMDQVALAVKLEAEGRHICHLEVGQPLMPAPTQVLDAAKAALDDDRLGYTHALGVTPLREAIARRYRKTYSDVDADGYDVSPDDVVVVTGSSAGFLLAFTALFDSGDAVAVPQTCYPCYRNILGALAVKTVSLPLNAEYKITAKELKFEVERREREGEAPLKGLILSSPGNPTGATLNKKELYELCEVCEELGVRFISDEIYHGIVYDDLVGNEASAIGCAAGRRSSLVINSFSKYQCMTGWRLGWLVLPEDESIRDSINRLAQNMYINAPTLSQQAAVALFDDPEVDRELDRRVAEYAKSRKVVLDTLTELGLNTPGAIAPADGAFYVYVDLKEKARNDATNLCIRLLKEAGVAITPGSDFEERDGVSDLGERRIRFSYAGGVDEVSEGMRRFKEWWPEWEK
ncbi:hypothetical protein TrST_g4390 [Triparma strigata]|uniref:Aminotransferase class I/classII large domain-containing protein n=1 Tax=Triparma strigata TaxID=1606541 RepID=A0A9W7E583_9STRA|nr:hypothetical protein TrST_g4390 [Triparma strigata]